MLRRNYFYIDRFDRLSLCKQKLNDEYLPDTVIGITAFISAANAADFFRKRKQIQSFFHEHFGYLPVSVVSQAAGKGIALEIWANDACKHLRYKRLHGVNHTVYDDGTSKALWIFGASANDIELPFREQVHYAFELVQALLSAEDYSMDDLVRQWNYIPEILKTTFENARIYQHYQLFNDIRQYYYGIYKREAAYPAATGIGMDCGPVTIDLCAIQKTPSTRIVGLSNPNQTSAYNYDQDVLAGSPLQENERKKAPLFERAKYVAAAEKGLIFISGTAAIRGESTVGINDITGQTAVTINNMENLTSIENLNNHHVSIKKGSCTYFRVYVKDPGDIPRVRELCAERYPDIPALYVKADICRDNLLVEIEGEAETFFQ